MKKLEAKKRDIKESVKKIREEGFVPGVVYAKGVETFLVKVPDNIVRSLWKDIKNKEHFILDVEGDEYTVLLQDIDVHVTTGAILHMDFFIQK